MDAVRQKDKIVVVGAGPVGSLAALYAASRGNDVEIYELRGGKLIARSTLGVASIFEGKMEVLDPI